MAYLHQGMNRQFLGRIDSDEEFTKKLHHIMKLIDMGYPVRYYTDKFNRIRVYRNNSWPVIDDLATHEKLYDWRD